MFLPINATRSKTVATWACSSEILCFTSQKEFPWYKQFAPLLEREASAKNGSSGNVGGSTGGSGGGGGGGFGIGGMFASMGAALGLKKMSGGLAKAGIFGLTQMMSETLGNAVSEMTGDSELGSAAANAAKFGGIGALFGKKFAVLGAVAGAFATPENIEMLGEIGDTLGQRGKEVKDALAGLNIALPSLSTASPDISFNLVSSAFKVDIACSVLFRGAKLLIKFLFADFESDIKRGNSATIFP